MTGRGGGAEAASSGAAPLTERLRCVVVDDEPLARRVLEMYIDAHASLQLVASLGSAVAARAFLQETQTDLLFLDIRMPALSGFELLRTLPTRPAVILTTAHAEHALDGFDVGAVDYLLKPVPRERFLRAVARVLRMSSVSGTAGARPTGERDGARGERGRDQDGESIFIRVEHRLIRLALRDVAFVSAYENYVRFHTNRRVYLSKRTMTEVAHVLGAHGFVRVHRSYLVNVAHVERVTAGAVVVAGSLVPLSRRGRDDLRGAVRIL